MQTVMRQFQGGSLAQKAALCQDATAVMLTCPAVCTSPACHCEPQPEQAIIPSYSFAFRDTGVFSIVLHHRWTVLMNIQCQWTLLILAVCSPSEAWSSAATVKGRRLIRPFQKSLFGQGICAAAVIEVICLASPCDRFGRRHEHRIQQDEHHSPLR